MAAPAIVVRLEFERRPVAHLDCDHEEDAVRLDDWLTSHPKWAAAVAQLLDEGRAA
jgi:hypothetical protein